MSEEQMDDEIENAFPDAESITIDDYAKQSYLNYSMYVILDRALPFVGDGLKPVHRRIIYAMNQLRLSPQGKYKKAARTVGDVLGKYHPHGDCLSGSTIIPLLNGEYKTISELVKNNYTSLNVLAYDKKKERLVPAKAYAWRVGQNTNKMIEITLSTGEKYKTTHNHQYFTQKHGEVAAKNLTTEMSIVGGFITRNTYKHIAFNASSNNNSIPLHKLIGESIYGSQNGDYIFHHKDENQHNNTPLNIELTDRRTHPHYHKEDGYKKGLENGRLSMFSEEGEIRQAIKIKNQTLMNAYNKDQGLYKAYKAIDYLIENNKDLTIENYNKIKEEKIFYNLTSLEKLKEKYNLSFEDLINKERKSINTAEAIGLTKKHSENQEYKERENNNENGSLHKAIAKVLTVLLAKYHVDNISWELYEQTANEFAKDNKHKTVFNSKEKLQERGWNIKNIREFAKQVYSNYLCRVVDVKEIILDEAEDFYDFTVDGYENMIICSDQENKSQHDIDNFIVVHNSSCYGAMVKMAQPFSIRYPLVDGQGNWGSIDDPSSFAAMRYTEAKLAPYSTSLLTEMEKSVVDWAPNFDGSLEEPLFFPAQLPNIIINGTSGIAVGMATDIVPHNIGEVAKACSYLIKNPTAKTATLMKYIHGPDFPTGGQIITPTEEIEQIYETGRGSIKLRASYEIEDKEIVIKEVPADTSTSRLLMQIGDMINNKKLPLVEDIRDEGDKNDPIRLVIVPKKKTDPHKVMEHLFATTELEKNIKVNMNMICLDKRPKVLGLKDILTEWLVFRRDVITRRFQALLERTQHRLHILEGYEKVLASLEEVIKIIRFAENPLKELMKKIDLTEIQANHILETKIRNLSKLDDRVKDEKGELRERETYCKKILAEPEELDNIMKKEIQEASKKYGDERKSLIEYAEPAKAISEEEMMPSERTTVVVSEKGWIRAGKGTIDGTTLSYKNGDNFLKSAEGMSNDIISIIDTKGKVYNVAYKDIPNARGYGEPLSSKIGIGGTSVVDVIIAKPNDKYLFISSSGYGFYFEGSDLETKMKAGKKMFSLKDNESIQSIQKIDTENRVAVVTTTGRGIAFDMEECQYRSKGKGIQFIKVSKTDTVSDMLIFKDTDQLKINNRYIDDKTWESMWGNRGRTGKVILSPKQQLKVKD